MAIEPLNVKRFGARGDGVTNDQVAIQLVLDTAEDYQEVVFPEGTYNLAQILLDDKHYRLRGLGQATIKILSAGDSNNVFVNRSPDPVTGNGVASLYLDNLRFQDNANAAAAWRAVIAPSKCGDLTITQCQFVDINNTCIGANSSNPAGGSHGSVTVRNCQAWTSGTGNFKYISSNFLKVDTATEVLMEGCHIRDYARGFSMELPSAFNGIDIAICRNNIFENSKHGSRAGSSQTATVIQINPSDPASFISKAIIEGNVLLNTNSVEKVVTDTVESVDTGADTLTMTAHAFVDGNSITFSSTGDVPAPLVAGTTYYVTGKTTDTIKVESTPGGGAINLTSVGSGTITAVGNAYTTSPSYEIGAYTTNGTLGSTTIRGNQSYNWYGSGTSSFSNIISCFNLDHARVEDNKIFAPTWQAANGYRPIVMSTIAGGTVRNNYLEGSHDRAIYLLACDNFDVVDNHINTTTTQHGIRINGCNSVLVARNRLEGSFAVNHVKLEGVNSAIHIGEPGWLNVLDFGANPTGVADTTAAIQAALDFAATFPTTERPLVYIPSGKYLVTELFVGESIEVRGDGPHRTRLLYDPTDDNTSCIALSPDDVIQKKHACVRDLYIRMRDNNAVSDVFTGNSTSDLLDFSSPHPFANGQMVVLSGSDLPEPLTATRGYYVVNAATNTIQLSLTSGGSAITLTDNGSGTLTATRAFFNVAGIRVNDSSMSYLKDLEIYVDDAVQYRDWCAIDIIGREQFYAENIRTLAPTNIKIDGHLDTSNFHNFTYLNCPKASGLGLPATWPNAAIYVTPGAALYRCSFTGRQAAAVKHHYLHWQYDSTATPVGPKYGSVPSANYFEGVRTEQGVDPTKFEVMCDGSSAIGGLVFNACTWKSRQHGLKLQNCGNVTLLGNYFGNTNSYTGIPQATKVTNDGGDILITIDGGHKEVNGSAVRLTTTSSMPGNLGQNVTYYVVGVADFDPDDPLETLPTTLKLSATEGGSPIAYSSAGAGNLSIFRAPTILSSELDTHVTAKGCTIDQWHQGKITPTNVNPLDMRTGDSDTWIARWLSGGAVQLPVVDPIRKYKTNANTTKDTLYSTYCKTNHEIEIEVDASTTLAEGGNIVLRSGTSLTGPAKIGLFFDGTNWNEIWRTAGTEYISGSGSPSGSVTPDYIGQEYLDTTGNAWYKSYGLTNTDWQAL